jgi:hypothetical protein
MSWAYGWNGRNKECVQNFGAKPPEIDGNNIKVDGRQKKKAWVWGVEVAPDRNQWQALILEVS